MVLMIQGGDLVKGVCFSALMVCTASARTKLWSHRLVKEKNTE